MSYDQLSRRCRHCNRIYSIKVGHTCKHEEIKKVIDDGSWINSFLMNVAKGLIEARELSVKHGKVYIEKVNWIKKPDEDKKRK